MTYDFLLIDDLDPGRLAAALAELASVPVGQVDVAAHGVEERNWKAPVLCTYEPAAGDVSWSLDIYLGEAVRPKPTERQAAMLLADRIGTPVIFPDEGVRPSAYWLAAPGGVVARARLYDQDVEEGDDRPAFTIDAVNRPVPGLPDVRVAAMPEVIRDVRMSTPVSDQWDAWVSAAGVDVEPGSRVWLAGDLLGAWEGLAARMAAGWPPDGWYPAEYYRDDLKTRDELAEAAAGMPPALAERFGAALNRVDEAFRAGTREVEDDPQRLAESRGWWWRRLPDPEPWPSR
jgi:hypothetical protein